VQELLFRHSVDVTLTLQLHHALVLCFGVLSL
jgi:hypothetical protein